MGGNTMTKCIVLGDDVINVGDWDFCITQEEVQEFDPTSFSGNGPQWRTVTKEVITNPLPDGAIEEDIALAWTVDGRIVRAEGTSAYGPFLQGTS